MGRISPSKDGALNFTNTRHASQETPQFLVLQAGHLTALANENLAIVSAFDITWWK